ncbi:MAG: c-type cytochrome, partial [Segetibacter sp.]
YMLWIYALFALMPPAIESYVMFIGPIIVIVFLFSFPFINNKGERSPIKRPWAIAGVIATVVIVGLLLVLGNNADWSPHFKTKKLPASVVNSADITVLAGSNLFYDKGCLYCHKVQNYGGNVGPDLTHVARRLNEQQMKIRIINGGDNMPAYGPSLKENELKELVAFLKSRR